MSDQLKTNQNPPMRRREEIQYTGTINYHAASLEALLDIRELLIQGRELNQLREAYVHALDSLMLTSREQMEVERATAPIPESDENKTGN